MLSLNPKLAECLPDDGLVLIIGRRGSGKSTLGYCILEYEHYVKKRPCYVYNFPKPELLPKYIHPIDTLEFPEGSVVLIDEGYMNFSARSPLSHKNRFVSNLNGLARQKGLLIIYISQESSSIDINIIRGIEVILIKALSMNQVRFERKEIRNFLKKVKDEIDKLGDADIIRKSTYVVCDLIGKKFEGLIVGSNTKPLFWNEEISKAWAGISLTSHDDELKLKKKKDRENIDTARRNKPFLIEDWYNREFERIFTEVYKKYKGKTFDANKFDKAYKEAMSIFLKKFPEFGRSH